MFLDMELYSAEINVLLRILGVSIVILVNIGKKTRSTGNVLFNILECSNLLCQQKTFVLMLYSDSPTIQETIISNMMMSVVIHVITNNRLKSYSDNEYLICLDFRTFPCDWTL